MDHDPAADAKILSLPELLARREAARAEGRSVVQCHGCFDLVHPGHVRHLQHAARHGDILLVTITGDGLLSKGEGRPLIPQELRAENLAALDCVDWVCVDNSPTAAELLERVQPDVYVKGREYERNSDPRFAEERRIVEGHGGRVVFTSGDVVFSSTALIAALEESEPQHVRLREIVERYDLTSERVEGMLSAFRGKRICVVGETIVDTYIWCDRPEVAGESPVLTLRPTDWRTFDGGAAIVARHLAAMGARPMLVTGHPRTADAEALRERLKVEGVETRWIELDRPLVEKQRFLVGQQKVMKLDLVEPVTLDAKRQGELIEMAADAAGNCDGAIILDYGGGLLTTGMTQRLCESLRPCVDVLTGDVSGRRSNLLQMVGMDLVCPSESELRDALQQHSEGLSAAVWRLLQRTGTMAALVTLGAEGLIAFERLPDADFAPHDWSRRLGSEHVPALVTSAVDQLGCGDSLLAAATLALTARLPLGVVATLGAVAAAAQAQRLGNAVIGADDLRKGMKRIEGRRLAVERRPAERAPAVRLVS